MGNKGSHFRRASANYSEKIDPELDPLNLQTLKALKIARERSDKQDVTCEKLLLKFSVLELGFDKCHEVFTTSTSKKAQFSADKKLPLVEARKARQKLGINLSPEEANELFMIPPGAEDEINILFIDFLIACFIMIMHKGPNDALKEGVDEDLVNLALVSMDAFNHLDSDENGFLFKEDITRNLRDVDSMAHAPKTENPAQNESDAIAQRWAFMDYDKDGRASFRDFMGSLHAWVMGDRSK